MYSLYIFFIQKLFCSSIVIELIVTLILQMQFSSNIHSQKDSFQRGQPVGLSDF